MSRYTTNDAIFDAEALHGAVCPRHGLGCRCCIDCGAPAGRHMTDCLYARENLDTIELRVGRVYLSAGIDGPELLAWVFVNGEPVEGFGHNKSWAHARKQAQRVAGELWYRARLCGLSAHPNTRPQWSRGEEGVDGNG